MVLVGWKWIEESVGWKWIRGYGWMGFSAGASAYMYPEDESHDRNADQADNSIQQIRDDFFEDILSLHGAGFRFVFHGWRGNCDQYRKAGSPGRPDLQAWTPDRSDPAGLDAAPWDRTLSLCGIAGMNGTQGLCFRTMPKHLTHTATVFCP